MQVPEIGISSDAFFSSVQSTEIPICLLSKAEIIKCVQRLVHGDRLNDLGKSFYCDLLDRLVFTNPHQIWVAKSLHEAAQLIPQLVSYGKYLYITGGLEAMHHLCAIEAACVGGIDAVIMGLETPDYIQQKGRRPIFTLSEKISLWSYLLPPSSLLFVIPLKPEPISSDEYYDWIGNTIGVLGNSQVYYPVFEGEPISMVQAKQRRAYPGNLLFGLTIGKPQVHTSELLTPEQATL